MWIQRYRPSGCNLGLVTSTMHSPFNLSFRKADKYFAKFAKDFMDKAYKQMGVHVFMFVGYRNSDGDFVRSKYDRSPSTLSVKHLIFCQNGNRHCCAS